MEILAVTVMVPLTEDKTIGRGELHPPYRWRLLQDAFESQFGGWTNSGTRTGVWREPESGRMVEDESRTFVVDVPRERLDEMRTLVCRACKTFVQQCLRIEIAGVVEYLEGGPDDAPL